MTNKTNLFKVKVDPQFLDTKDSFNYSKKTGRIGHFYYEIKTTNKENAKKLIEERLELEKTEGKHLGAHHFIILGVYTLDEYQLELQQINL